MPVYKDKKRGTYYVSVYVEMDNGKRKRILRRGFKTKAEAKRAEANIITNTETTDTSNPPFSDVLDEYIKWYVIRRKAESIRRIKKEIRLYIRPFFEGKFIKEVDTPDVIEFHDFLLEKLSVRSSKNVHGLLSTILNYSIKKKYVNKNVARELGNIQMQENKTMDYWTLDQFKEFIGVVYSLKYQAVFMCLFYSGARVGELAALTWKDINFDANTIHINKTANKGTVTNVKTEKSVRTIQMPSHTMNLLRQMKLQNKPKSDYFVFGEYYDHLPQTSVHERFKHFLGYTNLERIRIHAFRHSHASYLINKGYDIQIVSKRLGHSKVSITYDIYSHLYPNKEEEAVEEMEKDFSKSDVVKLIK